MIIHKTKLNIKENQLGAFETKTGNVGFAYFCKSLPPVKLEKSNEFIFTLNPYLELQSDNKKAGHLLAEIVYTLPFTAKEEIYMSAYDALIDADTTFNAFLKENKINLPFKLRSFAEMRPEIADRLKTII